MQCMESVLLVYAENFVDRARQGGMGFRARIARRTRRRCGGGTTRASPCATPAACISNYTRYENNRIYSWTMFYRWWSIAVYNDCIHGKCCKPRVSHMYLSWLLWCRFVWRIADTITFVLLVPPTKIVTMTFLVTVFERCGSGNKEPVRLCKKKKKKKKNFACPPSSCHFWT